MSERFMGAQKISEHGAAELLDQETPREKVFGSDVLFFENRGRAVLAQHAYERVVTTIRRPGGPAYDFAERIVFSEKNKALAKKKGWITTRGGANKAIDELMDRLLAEAPDRELILFALRARIDSFKKEEEIFFERAKPVVGELEQSYQKSAHALGIPKESFDRLANTHYRLMDHLMMDPEKGGCGLTEFAPTVVYLDPNLTGGRLKATLAHELGHVLSGRTVTAVEGSMPGIQRVGVEMPGLTSEKEQIRRFSWLNEAVTERCAHRITGRAEAGMAYVFEMEVMDTLLLRGKEIVPFELLSRAYFENIPESGGRMVAWRECSAAIHRAWGDGFLVRLDDVMRSEDDKAVRELLAMK